MSRLLSHYFSSTISFRTLSFFILWPPSCYIPWVWLLLTTKHPKCSMLKKSTAQLSVPPRNIVSIHPLTGFIHMLVHRWEIKSKLEKFYEQVAFKKKRKRIHFFLAGALPMKWQQTGQVCEDDLPGKEEERKYIYLCLAHTQFTFKMVKRSSKYISAPLSSKSGSYDSASMTTCHSFELFEPDPTCLK